MKQIAELIERSDMTKRQIAIKADVKHPTIYNIVNGKMKDINLSTAIKIADVLDISLDEFREENAE